MGLKEVNSASFNSDVLGASKLVIVDFWADWCGPCKAMAPKLEEAAAKFGHLTDIVKIDVDANPDIGSRLGIRSIPTLVAFRDGINIGQISGNISRDALFEFIQTKIR